MPETNDGNGHDGGNGNGHGNGSGDDHQWVVQGTVRAADGTPQSRVRVVAFNKDLRKDLQLGEATTDGAGAYQVKYQPPPATPPDVADVDIFVSAYAADRTTVVFTSDVVFGAHKQTTIDCTIGGELVGPSEYSTVLAAVATHLDGVPLTDLREDDQFQDISFLATQLELDGARIAYVVVAARLQAQTQVPAPAFYGMMREGLPTDLPAILLQNATAQTHALEAALAANIIAPIPDWDVSKIVARAAAGRDAARSPAAVGLPQPLRRLQRHDERVLGLAGGGPRLRQQGADDPVHAPTRRADRQSRAAGHAAPQHAAVGQDHRPAGPGAPGPHGLVEADHHPAERAPAGRRPAGRAGHRSR
jgi:hypothetical protein